MNNLLTSNVLINTKHLEQLLEHCSGNFYWKDKKGHYLGVNKKFLNTSNIDSENEVVGKTDQDLPWQKQSAILMKNDSEIIHTEQSKILIEPVLSPQGEVQHYCSHKAPLYNNNSNIIGIMGLSYPLELLPNKETKLSRRQMDCLYYLVKGNTMKQIALILNLSPKTVEHYLDAVKHKLNCRNRAELVTKALQITEIKDRLQ